MLSWSGLAKQNLLNTGSSHVQAQDFLRETLSKSDIEVLSGIGQWYRYTRHGLAATEDLRFEVAKVLLESIAIEIGKDAAGPVLLGYAGMTAQVQYDAFKITVMVHVGFAPKDSE